MSSTTESARGETCTVRLPGCDYGTETTVFAHIAGVRFGHGMGKKTNLGAYACHKCHQKIDFRENEPEGYTRAEVELAHFQGMAETLLKLDEKGIIKL